MSTNIYTKKYEMLEKQNGVALLIHDFSEVDTTSSNKLTGEYSITLNGTCSVVRDGECVMYAWQPFVVNCCDRDVFSLFVFV
jgi:hypothetical protein